MNTLRWMLLILGAVLLFAIYWFDRKRRPPVHHRLLDDIEDSDGRVDEEAGRDNEDQYSLPPADSSGLATRVEPSFGSRAPGNPGGMEFPEPTPPPAPQHKPIKPRPVEPPIVTTRAPEKPASHQPASASPAAKASSGDERLVVLYVVPAASSEFTGEGLAEAFAQAELQYGEKQVFQRTVKLGGKDEILFLVTNMLKPGIFDLSRLRELRCRGLSLFMQLPGPIDALKAFNTMLHCAQVLAGKLGGEVLDASREPLDQIGIERLRGDIQLFGLKLRQAGQDD